MDLLHVQDRIKVQYANGTVRRGTVTALREGDVFYAYHDGETAMEMEVKVPAACLADGTVQVFLDGEEEPDPSSGFTSDDLFSSLTEVLGQLKQAGGSHPFGEILSMLRAPSSSSSLEGLEHMLKRMLPEDSPLAKQLADLQAGAGGAPADFLQRFLADNAHHPLIKELLERLGTVSASSAFSQSPRWQEELSRLVEEGLKNLQPVSGGASSNASPFAEAPEAPDSFFASLADMPSAAPLVRALGDQPPLLLAAVAAHLPEERKQEFLYLLPDAAFAEVLPCLPSISAMAPDVLRELEQQAEACYRRTASSAQASDPFSKLFAAFSSEQPDDAFTQQLESTVADLFDPAKLEEMRRLLNEGAGGALPPLPDEAQLKELVEATLENAPKMMEELLKSLRPRRDDDDLS